MYDPMQVGIGPVQDKVQCPHCENTLDIGEMALEWHGPVFSGPLTHGQRTGRIMASDTSRFSKKSQVDYIGHAECFIQFLEHKLYEDDVFDQDYTPQYLCAHCGEVLELTLCPSCTDDVYGLTCARCGNNSQEEPNGI
jgi:predicted RNA-binding Zn-ribbon protein involved in translation (DUF1610 family)